MREIHDDPGLREWLASEPPHTNVVLRGVDLRGHAARLLGADLRGVVLLGCTMSSEDVLAAIGRGALVFPDLPNLPYEPWRTTLYSPEELFAGFRREDPLTYCDTLDARVYAHFVSKGGASEPPMLEAFAQRLHDHGVTEALEDLLAAHPRVVAVMGGHGMSRLDPVYLEVARLSAALAQRGFLVATGGGPGAMEAANLGARFATASDDELVDAVQALGAAPLYKDREWLARAFLVRERHGAAMARARMPTLGVPTFFYGHEPPNAFATHHAKYFANCVREDGLVSLATHGIVFAPGSAGTVQEIFQDACQNHYGTVRGLVSPMVLYGTRAWSETLPVAPLLRALAGQAWGDRILLSDDPVEILRFVTETGPRRLDRAAWSFCAAHGRTD
jgi:predicted Rossmann-fold nucleotide-binding protein